ncbi:hypothetical protein LWI29_025604 [Acer saccharum]|uniref:DUF4283 domain-containing protein n=1 Tax=Acer saccharum TaxID=4024 RepID=A0AA39VE89_ACESA|nr:hypothetical protein LWI29_025604 [Acer saccharum]
MEEMKQVFWEGSSEGQKWLNKCAVGTLRRFDKVSRVNRELQNRGIAFKASYLGDKFILWRFEDEQTCLSFIKNRSAWEDNFSSMSQWRATTVAKMKPSPTPISDFERQSHGVGGDNRGWQMVSQDRAKAKQVGSYGVASGSQINVRDKRKLSQLDSRKGVSNDFLKKDKGKQRGSAEDGHQVLQENFAIEENLVFETEEDDLEWNLDKEICKIIEIGCALGCDFSGKENFIGEELMRREKEDQRRFRESNE